MKYENQFESFSSSTNQIDVFLLNKIEFFVVG